MPERHVDEHAQLSLKSGKQASVDRGIHQVANESGISPKTVREGIVFQPLFLQIEDVGGGGEPHVDQMRRGGVVVFFSEEQSGEGQ